MQEETHSFTCTQVHKKVFLGSVFLFLLAALTFSVFFLVSDYHSLSEWYMNLGPCFYKHQQWSTSFFTQGIKDKGNAFAGASALIAIAGIIYLAIKWGKYTKTNEQIEVDFSGNVVYWYAAVVVSVLVLGTWEWRLLSSAYDEVFSAVNCAEMPLFRTLTYYMLPNNHIGFNVLNKVLFGWYGDFVASGRFISLMAYMGAMVCVFFFLCSVIKNRYLVFVALIPVALQFHTLGFSAQARGYELMLLCGWISILSVWGYIKNNNSLYLFIGTLASVLGFILIPSYMYLYLAQLVYMCIYMLYKRKWDVRYIKVQLALFAAVFIWYTPALCFSGIQAFADNKWVRPMVDSVWAFIPMFWVSFMRFINDCFYGDVGPFTVVCYFIFITPILLLFTKDRKNKHISAFYIALWISYILYSLYFRRTPFHRTLIIHFSFTMACCAYAYYVLIAFITDYIRTDKFKTTAKTIAFVMPVLLYSFYQFSWNTENASWAVYGYDINSTYKSQSEGIRQIPEGSSVSFSDEAFYFYYIARKMNYNIHKCEATKATYYIKSEPEMLPSSVYKFMSGCGDDYAIYKRE